VLEANPDLLVVVEGVTFPRIHLQNVGTDPIRLPLPNRLVYAAHNYGYIGPGLDNQPPHGSMDWPTFRAQMDKEWGYVVQENKAFTGPVWVSEFGEGTSLPHEPPNAFARSVTPIATLRRASTASARPRLPFRRPRSDRLFLLAPPVTRTSVALDDHASLRRSAKRTGFVPKMRLGLDVVRHAKKDGCFLLAGHRSQSLTKRVVPRRRVACATDRTVHARATIGSLDYQRLAKSNHASPS
jgi:hypothetical protein